MLYSNACFINLYEGRLKWEIIYLLSFLGDAVDLAFHEGTPRNQEKEKTKVKTPAPQTPAAPTPPQRMDSEDRQRQGLEDPPHIDDSLDFPDPPVNPLEPQVGYRYTEPDMYSSPTPHDTSNLKNRARGYTMSGYGGADKFADRDPRLAQIFQEPATQSDSNINYGQPRPPQQKVRIFLFYFSVLSFFLSCFLFPFFLSFFLSFFFIYFSFFFSFISSLFVVILVVCLCLWLFMVRSTLIAPKQKHPQKVNL